MAFLADEDVIIKWFIPAVLTVAVIVIPVYLFAGGKPRQDNEHCSSNGNFKLDNHGQLERDKILLNRRQKWLDALEEKEEKQKDTEDDHGDGFTENLDPQHSHEPCLPGNTATAKGANGSHTSTATEIVQSSPHSSRRNKPKQKGKQHPVRSRPPMTERTNNHPGIEPFHLWYHTEASLYRIYVVGRTDDVPVICPFLPQSERGILKVDFEVMNETGEAMDVFWVDYKGREVHWGSAISGQTHYQTTYIGHPWTFRTKKDGKLLAHYVIYKVTPTTDAVNTVSRMDPEIGLYTFTLTTAQQEPDDKETCQVIDPVYPTEMKTPAEAIEWTLHHMERCPQHVNGELLIKYLSNIVGSPADPKYRQIRIANRVFFNEIWNTPCRGILLAAGFVERGAYAELGSEEELPEGRIQDISNILYRLVQWNAQKQSSSTNLLLEQPLGAMDGFGRAGFGRAGQMNS